MGFSTGIPPSQDDMEPTPQHIRLYRTATGRSPFREWIRSLRDTQGIDIINARITRLRLGNFGDCKALGGGTYELRIDFGPGYRVYFGREGDRLVILLIGGDKSSQTQDIAQAQEYWRDYQKRVSN